MIEILYTNNCSKNLNNHNDKYHEKDIFFVTFLIRITDSYLNIYI